jgi:hypothetical protein
MKKIAVILLVIAGCCYSSLTQVIALRDLDKYINTDQLKP